MAREGLSGGAGTRLPGVGVGGRAGGGPLGCGVDEFRRELERPYLCHRPRCAGALARSADNDRTTLPGAARSRDAGHFPLDLG